MKEYEIKLYKNEELIRTTNMTISGQNLTMEKVAEQVYRLSMISGYNRDYDLAVVLDPTETRNYSIVDLV